MDKLYNPLMILSAQPDCSDCNFCERNIGLVYLIADESRIFEGAGIKTATTSDGIIFLERKQNTHNAMWCSCFDVNKNRCSIYHIRPLCCRLYPIDLMRLDGALFWVAHTECPITNRYVRERRIDVLAAITVQMESALSSAQLKMWINIDKTSQTIEAFSRDYCRVIRLRQFRAKLSFP